MSKQIRMKSNASESESRNREQMFEAFRNCPIPANEVLGNLPLFIKRQDLTQILFINELYQKAVEVHGVIMEFGVRWGKNLALMQSLRGIYEPFNHNRRIIGFDTFEGFLDVNAKDGASDIMQKGAYNVTAGYEGYLANLLSLHEQESPIAHIRKYELRKGDAGVELEKYLKLHPETIVAFAYFDFDVYAPTKRCLELILGHITKGSVIGFDELNVSDYPGETTALKEVLGLDRQRICHSRFSPTQSYLVWGE